MQCFSTDLQWHLFPGWERKRGESVCVIGFRLLFFILRDKTVDHGHEEYLLGEAARVNFFNDF